MTSVVNDNQSLDRIVIDPATDGSITIKAVIEDASEEETDYKRSKSMSFSVTASRSALNGIEIGGGSTYSFPITNTTGIDNGIGDLCSKLAEIPAFFSNGSIVLDYVFMDTDQDDNKADLKSKAFIEFLSPPVWYPYSLVNYTNTAGVESMAPAMEGLIGEIKSSTKYETLGDNTPLQDSWSINTWPGIMPIVVNEIETKDSDGNTLPKIKRGCLPIPTITIKVTNNLGDKVRLSSIKATITINYYEDDWLMDMTNTTKKNVVKLYPSPKFLKDTDKKHLWAIADGYELAGGDKTIDEIVKVFAYYKKTNPADITLRDSVCIVMDPIIATAGVNYPAFVYKTLDTDAIGSEDHARQNSKGFESDEFAKVITPYDICVGNGFKDVVVHTDLDKNNRIMPVNNQDCVFVITTNLRTDILETAVTESEFLACFKKIRFYDVDVDFEQEKKIPRKDISEIFYESLSKNYETSVRYESNREDIAPHCRLKINDKTEWLPLYNDTELVFGESLSTCNDGIRSGDLFYYSQSQALVKSTTPVVVDPLNPADKVNKIELKPTKHRYTVGISLSYGKFKGAHIHKWVDPDKKVV